MSPHGRARPTSMGDLTVSSAPASRHVPPGEPAAPSAQASGAGNSAPSCGSGSPPSPGTPGCERRAFPRVAIQLNAKVSTPQGAVRGRTLDLSAGGAFFSTPRALAIGTRVRLTLDRGDDRNPLELPAEVVRIGDTAQGRFAGLGLRFRDLDAIEIALLESMTRPG